MNGWITVLLATILVASSSAEDAQAFLNPPRVLACPSPGHAIETRRFSGIPSIAVAPEGRLWAIWYAGTEPKEDEHNYAVLSTSGDGGTSWAESRIVDPDGDGPVRAFDPELWLDPDGRLWSFWAQAIDHDAGVGGVWAMVTENPDSPSPAWSEPRRLTDGVMMCKPLVLSTGEWVLPASTWRDTDYSARMAVSEDRGATWQVRGACQVPRDVRNFDEHSIVERKDGSLWMLVRTNYGIGESVSTDRGRTWSPLEPSAIAHPAARFFIRRLASGNLFLVKHGPIATRTGRSHLTAYLSRDDGRTWSGGLLLDEREGVSYPDGQQSPDGTIYLIYDHSRTGSQDILLARFTETDVLAANADSPSVSLRIRVSQGVREPGQPE